MTRPPFTARQTRHVCLIGLLALTIGLPLAAPARAQSPAPEGLSCQQLIEALSSAGRVPLQGVSFDFNRSSLRPDSLPALIAARDAILTLGGQWALEGHTDNIGTRDYNQRLSEARAMAVRDWLLAAGVASAQLSAAGYSFDRPMADNASESGRAINRRVELVGSVDASLLGFGGPDGLDPCPATLTPGHHGEPSPPIEAWTANHGQAWLPFSYLMATGYGGPEGWRGDRIEMPPGTQPQACQALCLANTDCAAFSFEPAGSFFVEMARCAMLGFGTEVNLVRSNAYFEDGSYFASGLKPEAAILTPEAEAIATRILADLTAIETLRAQVQISAPEAHDEESWMPVALTGHVPPSVYESYLEITEFGDYNFDWSKSRSSLPTQDLADGRSGQIWVPARGDYVLRYVIQHPTADRHVIVEQPLRALASGDAAASEAAPAPRQDAAPVPGRGGTVEHGVDRPGMDIGQTALADPDPLQCQALCAGDPECRSWTYVNPGIQGEKAMCWTKFGVPEGFENPCCSSGVMDQTSRPSASARPDAGDSTALVGVVRH